MTLVMGPPGLLESTVIQRTLRVPELLAASGDSVVLVRQLDAALLDVGFKLSGELFAHLAGSDEEAVRTKVGSIVDAVRHLVGDHIEHNVYFRDFPANVPDTREFWAECLYDALQDPRSAAVVELRARLHNEVNLLELPLYGRYPHTYTEMVAAHDVFVRALADRVTVLHLGRPLGVELSALYGSLATATMPANEADLALLGDLAELCLFEEQPQPIPVRERRAVINAARLKRPGHPLLVDTVTDVLRAVVVMSGGDVSLREPSRLRSLRRHQRRSIMAGLERVVAASWSKLADVARHSEAWKRLGEWVHPHEYPQYPQAQEVFVVARGERRVPTLAARVEHAFAMQDRAVAAGLLSQAPGMLVRSVDRLLREAGDAEHELILEALEHCVPRVSGRVLLSLLEHLLNRTVPDAARVFLNQGGRAWVTQDDRLPLDQEVVQRAVVVLEEELVSRLPDVGRLVVDPRVRALALPLSGKAVADGFGVMPRGSVTLLEGELLRFFVYWQQREQRTDFDLSVLLLDEEFSSLGHLSWTRLEGFGGCHSGDIVDAPSGASEFIDLALRQVSARYIVPQVNVYSGEGFDEVAESMFGFMTRDTEQQGLPFEPRTVRVRSALRGTGRVVLPLVFQRGEDDRWSARWLHLTLRGAPQFNQVEANRVSTALLVRALVERHHLPVGGLLRLLEARTGREARDHVPGTVYDEVVTFVGVERPEGLPSGSEVVSPAGLVDLVGAPRV